MLPGIDMRLPDLLRRFASCESGLSMVEYALLLVIGVAVAAGVTEFGRVLATLYDSLKLPTPV